MLRASLIGNLGADPEIRYTAAGEQITSIRVAVNQRKKDPDSDQWRDATNWFRVRCTGWTAEAAQKLATGSRVYVVGRLEINEYQRRDGASGVSYDVWANEVHSVGPSRQDGAAAGVVQGGARADDEEPF